MGGAPASAELLLRDATGVVKGRLPVELGPFESVQVNDVHRTAAVAGSPGDLFELRVPSGAGRVVAWA